MAAKVFGPHPSKDRVRSLTSRFASAGPSRRSGTLASRLTARVILAEAGPRVVGIEGGLVGGELAGASTTTPDWAPVAKRIRDQATDI